jgi:hypothetical protein
MIRAECYSPLMVQLNGILKEKCHGKFTKVVLFLHDNALPTVHTQPRRKCPTWAPVSWSPTLFSGSGPVGLPLVPWAEKTIEMSTFFIRRGLLPRRPGWTESVLISFFFFFIGLHELAQRTKKCIELHGEYVEYIPCLVAVACFLLGRTKGLSASPCITFWRYICVTQCSHSWDWPLNFVGDALQPGWRQRNSRASLERIVTQLC